MQQSASREMRHWTISIEPEKLSDPDVYLLGDGFFECLVHLRGQIYRGLSRDQKEAKSRAYGLAGKRGGARLRRGR